jgi:hypothetical protein
LSKTIYPNEVLADVVLRWMLQAVQKTEATDARPTALIPDIATRIPVLTAAIANPTSSAQPTGPTGSGDIYGNVLEYGPGGSIFGAIMRFGTTAVGLLNKLAPQLGDNIQDLLGIKVIIRILTAARDRRIPAGSKIEQGDNCMEPSVYAYKDMEIVRTEGGGEVLFTVDQTARLNEACGMDGGLRYPSRTFESFQLWKRIFGS